MTISNRWTMGLAAVGAAAAAFAARIEEKSPSVRPPAALISSHISSRYSGGSPSRPGIGRCLAT